MQFDLVQNLVKFDFPRIKLSEMIPIKTFNWLHSECSNPPDSIFLWPDQSYSTIILNATDTEGPLEICGWYGTDTVPPVAYENCYRYSLDFSVSGGYSAWGISFDNERYPRSAYGAKYCTLESSDGTLGYTLGQILANGACIDQFRCFDSNSTLSIYESLECTENSINYDISSSPVLLALPEGLNGSFTGYLSEISKDAEIVYHWTTFYPLYLTAPDYSMPIDLLGACW